MAALLDLTGRKINMLLVIGPHIRKNNYTQWLCKCDCGVVKYIAAQWLVSKIKKQISCGCNAVITRRINGLKLAKLPKRITHGMSKSSEYKIWAGIKRRCYDKKFKNYKQYGGRGIKVCDLWINSFDNFYKDMGPRPSDKHQIDRINNDGIYEPSNCRWANRYDQAANKRNNVFIEYNGEKRLITHLSKEIPGGCHKTLRNRLKYGWALNDAMIIPVKKTPRKNAKA
jgi:hypothetical protein